MHIHHYDAATGRPATYLSPYCQRQVATLAGQVHRHLGVHDDHLDVMWSQPHAYVALRNGDPYQLHVAHTLQRPKLWRRYGKSARPGPAQAVGCPAAYLPSRNAIVATYQHQARTTDWLGFAHALVESCLLNDRSFALPLPAAGPPPARRAFLRLFDASDRVVQTPFDLAHIATLRATRAFAESQNTPTLSNSYLRDRWGVPSPVREALSLNLLGISEPQSPAWAYASSTPFGQAQEPLPCASTLLSQPSPPPPWAPKGAPPPIAAPRLSIWR